MRLNLLKTGIPTVVADLDFAGASLRFQCNRALDYRDFLHHDGKQGTRNNPSSTPCLLAPIIDALERGKGRYQIHGRPTRFTARLYHPLVAEISL